MVLPTKGFKLIMDLLLFFKIIFILGTIVALYAVIRNLDIIKIILGYWFDLLFGK